MTTNISEKLANNILETSFEAFPKDVVERAKEAVIDVVGCTIGGANDPGCPMILDLIREWGGKEESTVLAHGVRAPSHNVALVNAVMARSFDYGIVDIEVDGEIKPSHIGETLVPTALAVAEEKAIGGKDLLVALILGTDLVARIMAASEFSAGWDYTGIVNTYGAAAVAGRLLGLDKRQLMNAFGIALNQTGGTIQCLFDGVHSFKICQGLAAQSGIFGARLASKGFTGVKDALMGNGGYFSLYCRDYHPEKLINGLCNKFYTEVTFKPYPCCRGNHGAIDCTLEIIRKHDLEADDIGEVTLIVSPWASNFIIGRPFSIGDFPHVDAIYSLQYNVANVLLRKSVKLEHFTEEYIRDPRIAEIVDKVKMTSETWPAHPDDIFLATIVKVKTKDGREFSEHVNVPRGNEIYNPMSREEKRDKFRSNVSFTQKAKMANAEEALAMLDNLEEVDDITKIVKLLIS